MKKIKVAIVGVGNCASSLLQGIEFYKEENKNVAGLMHWNIGGYRPCDIDVVAAFDIDERKVGRDIYEAIFQPPNCAKVFKRDIGLKGVKVSMGRVLDGISVHMNKYDRDKRFAVSNRKEATKEEIVDILINSNAEILLNYMPVGSEKAAYFYAECALDAGLGFINCMPVFIASNPEWESKFRRRGLPVIGDDIKSQIGATIIHRTLANLFKIRGVKIEKTYQINIGGNTDFLNMLNRDRLVSKKISKTEAVQSVVGNSLEDDNIHIAPSDYVASQKDNKICFIRIDGRNFGNMPVSLDLKLSVEDSPNSAGIAIDAIRCCKIALDRGISGALVSVSSYFMKHPPKQFSDEVACRLTENFIMNKEE